MTRVQAANAVYGRCGWRCSGSAGLRPKCRPRGGDRAVKRRAGCQAWSPCATRVIMMIMYVNPSRRRNQLTPRASSSYAQTVIARYAAAVAWLRLATVDVATERSREEGEYQRSLGELHDRKAPRQSDLRQPLEPCPSSPQWPPLLARRRAGRRGGDRQGGRRWWWLVGERIEHHLEASVSASGRARLIVQDAFVVRGLP
jgi:hypothetical protein